MKRHCMEIELINQLLDDAIERVNKPNARYGYGATSDITYILESIKEDIESFAEGKEPWWI